MSLFSSGVRSKAGSAAPSVPHPRTTWNWQNRYISHHRLPPGTAADRSCLGVCTQQHSSGSVDREDTQDRAQGREAVREEQGGNRFTCQLPSAAQPDQEYGQVVALPLK